MTGSVSFVGYVSHRDHPSFENRKELVGKALAALYFDMCGCGDGELARISEMVRQRSAHRAPDNRVTLNEFLNDLHAKAVADWQEGLNPSSTAKVQLDAFKAHVDEISCARCTTDPPCNGSMFRDAGLVADGGRCLSIFTRMFTALIDLATDGYRDIVSATAPPRIDVTLKTEISRKQGGEVGGKTEFPEADDIAARQAEVTATLPLTDFGQEQLARLPYVLFHEVFVHCPESWTKSGPRLHTKETCGFREGFVDGAAASLLARSLNTGRVQLSDLPQLSGDFALETMSGHLARSSLVIARLPAAVPGLLPVESLRRKGAKAFALFREAIGTDAELLAAALNVLDATDDERSAYLVLLEAVSQALPGGLERATPYMRGLALDLRRLLSARPVDAEAIGSFIRDAIPNEY